MNKKLKIEVIVTFCFVLLGLTVLLNSCSKKDGSNQNVLASIGNKIISEDDFIKRFQQAREKNMSGLPDNGQVRRQILQNMVNEELLILEAKKEKFDIDEAGKLEKERIKTQELINIYHQKNIRDQIEINDGELQNLFVKLNTKIKARHLYAPTKEKADSLFHLVNMGIGFNELAKNVFDDPNLRDSGGLLGYFSVDDMELSFEEAAYQLKVGQVSDPIKTTDGYSIIRVDDRFTNPVITETEFLKNKNKLRSFLIPRKIKKTTQDFTESLENELEIKFNETALQQLYLSLNNYPTDNPFEDLENKNENFNQFEKVEVATSNNSKWDLKKLQNLAIFTSPSQRKWIKSKENLKDFLSGLIIRDYMLEQAKKEKFHKTEQYYEKVQKSFEDYLLTRIEDYLFTEFKIPNDTLQNYYNSDPSRFSEPPKIRLQEIVVSDKKTAKELIGLLNAGASFEQLAREHSERKWTAEKGGDLGFLYPEDFGNSSEQIFNLKVGQVASLIEMESRYAIFKCIEKFPARIHSFEEAYDEVEKTVRFIKKEKYRTEKINEIKKSVDNLQVYPERLKTIRMINNN